jgi:type III restriction enzyme
VKISVGALDELKDVQDITSPKCPIRFIITVQKLREGWDCPFAYVLCSLKETRSATAIEQIVGRILRLPNARRKQHPDLDCAFVFSVSDSLPEVLNELREALENNGFTTAEADRIIIPVPQGTLPLGLQPKTVQFRPDEEIDTAVALVQVAALAGKVKIDTDRGAITVVVPLDKDETEKLKSCVKTPEAKARVAEIVEMVRAAEMAFGGTGQTRVPTPYEQQIDFLVPVLCVSENGMLFEFEKTFLLEQPWQLSAKDAGLPDNYNPLVRPSGMSGVVDVGSKGEVQTEVLRETPGSDFIFTLHQQVLQLGGQSDWTIESLAAWLDQHIEHQDIPADESGAFLHKLIRSLMSKYDIADVGALAIDRFRLRDQIGARIQQYRDIEQKAAFQQFLLPGSALVANEDRAINFKTMSYEPSWIYEGGFQFKKHYFGPKPGELAEKTSAGKLTEEFQCAQFIDGLSGVEFWVRNLARKSTSFRLHTSKDWFYPDFLCKLVDGRVLAVEYKGKHLWTDAEDKRVIGAVWASRSKGRCLFVMPTDGDFSILSRTLKPL